MKRLSALFNVLDKWKPFYLLAGVLLILTSAIRMIEPKILQVAVDGVVLGLRTISQGNKSTVASDSDVVASLIYSMIATPSPQNALSILLVLALIYLVVAALRAGSALIAGGITAWATEKAIRKLRDRLFDKIQELSMESHHRIPTGEMVQRSTGDVDTVKRFLVNDVAEMIRLSALFFAAFWMMFIVHIPYALIAISLVPFITITSVVFFKKESLVWEAHEAEQDKLTAIIQENLSGIQVVRAFAREPEEKQRFDVQNRTKLALGLRHVKLHMRFWSFSDALVNLQVTLSLMAGIWYTLGGFITLGEFASFFTYSIMVTWPLRQVGQITSRMGMAAVAMDRMAEIFSSESEQYAPELGADSNIIIPDKFKGDIEFRNVSFRYPAVKSVDRSAKEEEEIKSSDLVLKNLNLKIEGGRHTALIGPTGSGKSTVIALLLRFYEPKEGAIFLDGIDIKCIDKKVLRTAIGTVLQKAFLFSSSLRKNIAFTDKDALDSEIESAAQDAGILGLLHQFPEGLDTVVGERGLTLSGGQQQRVALARTLLARPDILILDDTTSAVDTITEKHIAKALSKRRGDSTLITISHRIDSIRDADYVIVLEDGKLLQEGNAKDLRKQAGYYREVAVMQEGV
ncbi:MAG: ATP-binding cassette subfamily B protein [Limisphaerales bacterium]|jgi:ATP-binding cassette subfamily B protein